MSYGWLTESALMPKPAIPINVDNSSILELKVVMMKNPNAQTSGVMNAKKLPKKQIKRNKGIEERLQKDSIASTFDSDQGKLQNLQTILQKKAEIYETQAQKSINLKTSLVDFQLKKLYDMSENDKISYEQEKEKFLQYKKEELEEKQKNLLSQRPQIGNPCLGFQQSMQELERAQWEEQMIKELEHNLHDTNKVLEERVLVQQSYDKKLTDFEKQKLKNVLTEEIEAKEKVNELKRKRQETEQLRKEKLKKLVCLQQNKT